MMILFPTILNDESGLSETSVVAWIIFYDIWYKLSYMSRTSERWKAINSAIQTERNFFFQFWFLFENKIWHICVCRQPNDGSWEWSDSIWASQRGKQECRRFGLVWFSFTLYPPCDKRQRASSTEDPDYIPEQPPYDHWKLNVLIYTIEVLWMTLSTFFIESPSMWKCPIIIFSRSRGNGFSYAGETTKS
jgi:hypothetical protein